MERRWEAEKLEEAGRLPESSPMWHLPQMTAETGPSSQAHSGRKGPPQEISEMGHVKKLQRYWLGRVALHKICCYQMSTELLSCKCPFTCLVCKIAQDCGRYDLHFQVCVVMALPGSCRILPDQSPGRCEPMCNPHKTCYNYAQRYSTGPLYLWRASSSLKEYSSLNLFWISVDCQLCWELMV